MSAAFSPFGHAQTPDAPLPASDAPLPAQEAPAQDLQSDGQVILQRAPEGTGGGAAAPPISVESFTANRTTVDPGETVNLSVVASDTDSGATTDTLYYHWKASGGALSVGGSGGGVTYPGVEWTAPQTPGTYTISVIVNDTRYRSYSNTGRAGDITGGRPGSHAQ